MPKACVNGVTLHYQQSGQGPDLVLIHGLAANLAFWFLRIVPALNKRHRVTVYDMRGHGKSGTPSSGYTALDMADDLRALMDHLEIDSAHLVGHSFGGEVALNCAAFHPDRVSSLTLADARVRVLQPVQRLQDWADADWERERMRDLGLWLAEDEPEAGHRLLEECAEAALRQGEAMARAGEERFVPFGSASGGRRAAQRWLGLLRDTTAREDFKAATALTKEDIAAIRTPVLAIYGERSRCLPSLRELQRIVRGCESVTLPGVGHFFPIVKPDVFSSQVDAFLKRLEDGGISSARAASGTGAGSREARKPGRSLIAPRAAD